MKLDDEERKRLTHSLLFQTGYEISHKWRVEVFLFWIKQERIITQFGNTNKTTAQGIGDAVLLIKYKIISDKQQEFTLIVGAGPIIISQY